MVFRAPSYSAQQTVDFNQNLICAVLRFVIQGDLFAEAPKPPVSVEKKVLNESTKSTAQIAGKTDSLDRFMQRHMD